jgi:hypothetical protein
MSYPVAQPITESTRLVGDLILAKHSLGISLSATTVRTWLRGAGLGPVGTRKGMTWRDVVRVHRRSLLATDFFTVETIGLQRAVRALLH